jgi:RNA polymerase sigma-70 factor (ECF subfamily)
VDPHDPYQLDGTTHSLLVRARQGESAAFDAICRRYHQRLRRWAHGRLPAWARDGIDTDDLIQDVLMRTMERIDTFDPRHPGALQAYIHTILHNRIADAIRAARKQPAVLTLEDDHEDPAADPLRETIGRERFERYTRALERLDEDERALIILRFEWGFSHEEIARDTGRPTPDAARTALRRAVLKLGEEMSRG